MLTLALIRKNSANSPNIPCNLHSATYVLITSPARARAGPKVSLFVSTCKSVVKCQATANTDENTTHSRHVLEQHPRPTATQFKKRPSAVDLVPGHGTPSSGTVQPHFFPETLIKPSRLPEGHQHASVSHLSRQDRSTGHPVYSSFERAIRAKPPKHQRRSATRHVIELRRTHEAHAHRCGFVAPFRRAGRRIGYT